MYTDFDYKTKKALIADVKAGKKVHVYQPGGVFGKGCRTDGIVCIEGPHYPAPHSWYASATIKDGFIIKIKYGGR
jgi:hypothetical protein